MGIVAANIANYSLGAPKKPRVPADFMPTRLAASRDRDDRDRPERINRKKIAQDVRTFFERAIKIQNQNGFQADS